MQLSLGFIRSNSQILIKQLDCEQNKLNDLLIDATDLADHSLQGLFISETEHFEQLLGILEKEKKFYPILDGQAQGVTYSLFEEMPAFQFKQLAEKVVSQWKSHHNFQSLEELFSFTTHMRVLWHKDRISFLEELWFYLKNNLGAVDLSIVFNDVIQAEAKNDDGQKEQKPKLTQSLLSGSKKANFVTGGGKEQLLMDRYLDKWNEQFEVTEWDTNKGRFVATVMIDKSPLIMMAHLTGLTQFQRSLLMGLFKGLQS